MGICEDRITEDSTEFEKAFLKIYDGSLWTALDKMKDWQPPKPLVVVPQIVARYIKTEEDNDYNRVGTLVYGHYTADDRGEKHSELHEWIAENFDTFLEAIVNGYTVEKEKMFYLKNVMTNNYLMQHKLDFHFGESDSKEDSPHWQSEFNQSEIDSMKTGSYERIEVDK